MQNNKNKARSGLKLLYHARMLIEALIVAALIIPSIKFFAKIGPKLGISHPTFAVQGIFVSVVLALIFMRFSRTTLKEIGFFVPKGKIRIVVLALLATGIILIVPPFIEENILPKFGIPYNDLTEYFLNRFEGNTALYIPYMIFVVWGSAAIGEEFVARGFLFHRMEQIFKSFPKPWVFAVIGQAIVFGGFHYFYGPAGMIATGLSGLILGILFILAGRNIWAPILAHGLVNSIYITGYHLGFGLS